LNTLDKQIEELEKLFDYYNNYEHSIPDAIKRKMEIADEMKNLKDLKQLLNTPQHD
jgi:phage terminase large subunit